MPTAPRVLVVDDEPLTVKHLVRLLRKDGCRCASAASGLEAVARLESGRFDLVLTDLVLGDLDGIDVLEQARAIDADVEVIVVTGHGSVQTAIDAMRRGAFHYLEKPIRPAEVRHLAGQALDRRRLKAEVSSRQARIHGEQRPIIGSSPQMVELRALIRQVAASEANVLITGESGSGKELVARAIHQASPRATRPLMAINCASFTEELLANELFGHEKGAFTGATSAHRGLLESADGGTLFFDEVGDMSPMMQAKLLRVVQERELIRVGGARPISVDIRIIAATNQDLLRSARVGTFREDLYYRLAVLPIHVPPLSERREDIPLLVRHFLDRCAARSPRPVRSISREAMRILQGYDYPGNVRELENLVERATALASSDEIGAADLPSDLRDIETFTLHRPEAPLRTLREVEMDYIEWVLQHCRRNKSRAADVLGINRVSLYRKLKRANLLEE